MKLHWFRHAVGNVGDDLNPWLWPRLLPGLLDNDDSQLFVGIGTLLNQRLPPADEYWVFGSGFGYGTPPLLNDSWHFFCVRGPRTAQALGLDSSLAITDPAYLLREFEPAADGSGQRIAFMPHIDTDLAGDWQQVCQLAGVDYLSPSLSPDVLIPKLRDCKLLLTEAMHGAIIADALRVPWQPLRCAPDFASGKWQDWLESMELTGDASPDFPAVDPVWLGASRLPRRRQRREAIKRALKTVGVWSENWTPPLPKASSHRDYQRSASALRAAAKRYAGQLSDDAVLTDRLAQLNAALERLRNAIAQPKS